MPGKARRSQFRFNEAAGRYVDRRNGRFVPASHIREEIDRVIENIARDVRALSEQLRTRQITSERWLIDMRRLSKESHLWSAASAKGGWTQMAAADYGRVGQIVRREYAFMQRFAGEVNRGLPLDGRFTARAKQYTDAARRTFHVVETHEMEVRGMGEERSVRHAGDSCDGCIAEEARGWIPIGEGVPIGERDCRRNCKCTKDYR